MKIRNLGTKQITYKGVVKNPSGEIQSDKNDVKKTNIVSPVVTYPQNIRLPLKYSLISKFQIPGVGDSFYYKLQNGQKIVIVPKKGSTIVKTHVNVGSMNEPDNLRGISHYIEHNLFNGTEKLKPQEFFKETNKLGAQTNASTSFTKTDYYVTSNLLNYDDLEKIISLHADMIENPKFDLKQLEKEKGPVTSEISMVLDDDSNLAINKTLKNLFQIDTKSKDLIAGNISNIENITRKDVLEFYNKYYTPDNMVTVVVGEVSPEKTIELLAKNFSKFATFNPSKKNEELRPINSKIREDLISDKKNTATIMLGFASPKIDNAKKKFVLKALQFHLNGHKNSKINKLFEKDGISIDSGLEDVSNLKNSQGFYFISAKTNEEDCERIIKKLYNSINMIVNERISDKELQTIKNNLLKSRVISNSSSHVLNDKIGNAFLNDEIEILLNEDKIISELTVDDIEDCAKELLDLDKSALTVIHSKQTKIEDIKENYNKINLDIYKQGVSFGSFKKFQKKDKVIDVESIESGKLPNNVLFAVNRNNSDLTNLVVSYDAKVPMATNPLAPIFLEKMLKKGASNIPVSEYYENLAYNATNIDLMASDARMLFCIDCHNKDIPFALQNFKDIINNPRLTEESFNEIHKSIKNIIKSMDIKASSETMNKIFPEYNRFVTKEELEKAIETIKVEDVKELYSYILNNSMVTATISNNQSDNSFFINEMASLPTYKTFTKGLLNTYNPIKKSEVICKSQEQNQAEIMKTYTQKITMNEKDEVIFLLLNTILGGMPTSRLFQDLRETQKLAYRVNSEYDSFGNTGIMSLYIKTTTDDKESKRFTPENVKKAISGFDKHVETLKNEKVSEQELNSAKLYLKNAFLGIRNSEMAETAAISDSFNTKSEFESLNRKFKLIDEITSDDIKDAANSIFKGDSITSIVASERTISYLNNKS